MKATKVTVNFLDGQQEIWHGIPDLSAIAALNSCWGPIWDLEGRVHIYNFAAVRSVLMEQVELEAP